MGGNQNLRNEVYDVSADIMATVQKLSGGDPAKIRDIAAKTEKQKAPANTNVPKP